MKPRQKERSQRGFRFLFFAVFNCIYRFVFHAFIHHTNIQQQYFLMILTYHNYLYLLYSIYTIYYITSDASFAHQQPQTRHSAKKHSELEVPPSRHDQRTPRPRWGLSRGLLRGDSGQLGSGVPPFVLLFSFSLFFYNSSSASRVSTVPFTTSKYSPCLL